MYLVEIIPLFRNIRLNNSMNQDDELTTNYIDTHLVEIVQLINTLGQNRIIDIFPNIVKYKDIPLSQYSWTVRTRNVLKNENIYEWSDINYLTIDQIIKFRNFGHNSEKEFIRIILLMLIDEKGSTLNKLSIIENAEKEEIDLTFVGLQMLKELTGILSDFIFYKSIFNPDSTLENIINIIDKELIPDSVLKRWIDISEEPLSLYTGSIEDKISSIRSEIEFNWNEKRKKVFEKRILSFKPLTLEELGLDLSITRERVRQIENKCKTNINKWKDNHKNRRILWILNFLDQRLESANYIKHQTLYSIINVNDLIHDDDKLILVYLLGPFRQKGDWIIREGYILPTDKNIIIDLDLVNHPKKYMEIELDLKSKGVHTKDITNWFEQFPYIEISGSVIFQSLGLKEKILSVFRVLEHKLKLAELMSILGAENRRSTITNLLSSDKSFIKVAKNEYGLLEWDLDEYNGILELMLDYLDQFGSPGNIKQMKNYLSENFSTNENSIALYLGAPLFTHNGKTYQLRTDMSTFNNNSELKRTKGTFLVDENTLSMVLANGKDVERGSGISLPTYMAKFLDLQPGQEIELKGRQSNIKCSWSIRATSGPQLSSLSKELLFTGMSTSHQYRIEINRHTNSIYFHPIHIDKASSFQEKIYLFSGLKIVNRDLITLLAQSLKCDISQVKKTLAERGDTLILNLIINANKDNVFDNDLRRLADSLL